MPKPQPEEPMEAAIRDGMEALVEVIQDAFRTHSENDSDGDVPANLADGLFKLSRSFTTVNDLGNTVNLADAIFELAGAIGYAGSELVKAIDRLPGQLPGKY